MKLVLPIVFLITIFIGKYIRINFKISIELINTCMYATKYSILHWAYNISIPGHQEVKGLDCYQCTAEGKEDCHYARSGDGTDAPEYWFGDLETCANAGDHCMIARTRMLFTYNISVFCNILC